MLLLRAPCLVLKELQAPCVDGANIPHCLMHDSAIVNTMTCMKLLSAATYCNTVLVCIEGAMSSLGNVASNSPYLVILPRNQ